MSDKTMEEEQIIAEATLASDNNWMDEKLIILKTGFLGGQPRAAVVISALMNDRDAKIEKLRKALAFYADSTIYKTIEIAADHSHLYAAIENDKGQKAREALKGDDGGQAEKDT